MASRMLETSVFRVSPNSGLPMIIGAPVAGEFGGVSLSLTVTLAEDGVPTV